MKISTHALVSVSLLVAMAAILHQIILFHMPQGGSVTAGCMVPLLLVSYRYGVRTGVLAGILYGIINFIQEPFVVHPVQVLFESDNQKGSKHIIVLWAFVICIILLLGISCPSFCGYPSLSS